MNEPLNDIETRVLGCLLEKEMATPEYYPLSLNGLVSACNQKTNRQPVVSYDEHTVARALESLREKQLVYESGSGRVAKYGQNFSRLKNNIPREMSALCVLLLRGPQTVGEIRARADRMYRFDDLAETEATLKALEEMGYIALLPRQPGQKEARYAHLLSGQPRVAEDEPRAVVDPAVAAVREDKERLAALEERCEVLGRDLEELRREFLSFKAQFE